MLKRFKEFFNSAPAAGIILVICVLISLTIANSPLGVHFENFLSTELGIHTDTIHLRYPILIWINDGLMALFFLLVGMEIKKELVKGELSSPKKAALPILAALGGVLVPASIYLLFNAGTDTTAGWAIPMATDIAFALGILSILGDRVPISLKVFLAALAIVDDLIAILVIAVFYNSNLDHTNIFIALGLFGLLLAFNKMGVRKIYFYLIPGAFIWYFIHHSGVHATIAGVLVAMTLPVSSTANSAPPLDRLEHMIAVPVNFIIMPLFALANTNIRIESEMVAGIFTPLGLGIIFGLVIGKPIGISLVSWIAIKTGLCAKPDKAGWGQLIGVGMLAGIGFTMSIFISMLSFAGLDLLIAEAKFSILIASTLAGILGSVVLIMLANKKKPEEAKAI